MPVRGDIEEVLHVGTDVHRAEFLADGHDARLHAPVVGEAVASAGSDAEDGAVGACIGLYADFGSYGPIARSLC